MKKNRCNQERGIYIIWLAVILPILGGMLALSIDIGLLMSERQRAQTAADAASLAAAYTISEKVKVRSYSEVSAAAQAALINNGFSGNVIVGDGTGIGATPYAPTQQQSDYFSKLLSPEKEKYVGVTVTGTQELFFYNFIKPEKLKNLTFQAHSVAAIGTSAIIPGSCPGVWANSNQKAINLLQDSTFTVNAGGIYLNITASIGMKLNGSGTKSKLTADWIELTDAYANPKPYSSSLTLDCRGDTPCPKEPSPNRQDPAAPPPTNQMILYNSCMVRMDNGKNGGDLIGCDCRKNKSGNPEACDSPGPFTSKVVNGKRSIIIPNGIYSSRPNVGNIDYLDTALNVTDSNVIFQPSGTERNKLYYIFTNGNFEITNSATSGVNIIIDARDTSDAYGGIVMSSGSSFIGTARLYANNFDLRNASTINVEVFIGDQDKDGEYYACGGLPQPSGLVQ